MTPKGAFLTGVYAGGMEIQERLFQVSSEQDKLREELETYMADVKNRVSETDGTLLLDFGGEEEFSRAVQEQEIAWKFRTGRGGDVDVDEKMERALRKVQRLDDKLERLDRYAEEVRRETLEILGEETTGNRRSGADIKQKITQKSVQERERKDSQPDVDDAASVGTSVSRASRRSFALGEVDHVRRNRQLAAMEGSLTAAEEARVRTIMGDEDARSESEEHGLSAPSTEENAFAPGPAVLRQLGSVTEALGKCDGPFARDLTSVVSDAQAGAGALTW